eukprot:gene9362-12613_t
MWFLSQKLPYLKILSSEGQYESLTFDVVCKPKLTRISNMTSLDPSGDSNVKFNCRPGTSELDTRSDDMTPTDILIHLINKGNLIDGDDGSNNNDNSIRNGRKLNKLLTSLMMNGLPFVGLDDYVTLSDNTNKNLGNKGVEQILSFQTYKDSFGNFLNVRSNRLIIVSYDSCWVQQFIGYLYKTSLVFKNLDVRVLSSMREAMNVCCDGVWAIIELTGPEVNHYTYNNTFNLNNFPFDSEIVSIITHINDIRNINEDGLIVNDDVIFYNQSKWSDRNFSYYCFNPMVFSSLIEQAKSVLPTISIRMHPSSIPDTRNYEWTPLQRRSFNQQSGQLLYFISGFLTFQIEFQNFLSSLGLGGSTIATGALNDPTTNIYFDGNDKTKKLAETLMIATLPIDVLHAVVNATSQNGNLRPVQYFPLYHRAFRNKDYQQPVFWHSFGLLISIGLLIHFCVPAAICSGYYRREHSDGQLDVISTLPKLMKRHSMISWCICCCIIVFIYFIACVLFFAAISRSFNAALIPSTGLLLFGISLGPFSIIFGEFIRKSDTLVVAVPTFTFVTMLPGLFYYDLAFDVQRSFIMEIIISLLPSSAITLLLRLYCTLEAMSVDPTWLKRAPISSTPIYSYIIMSGYVVIPPTSSFMKFPEVEMRNSSLHDPEDNNEDNNADNNSIDKSHISLEVNSLTKQYKTNTNLAVVVLSNITSSLYKNTVTLLLGSNGAGKTTLMRILSGLDNDYKGSINLMDNNNNNNNQRQIGWCPQNEALFDYLTVAEHFTMYFELLFASNNNHNQYSFSINDYITNSLINLDMVKQRNKHVHELSGGMKRRLSLALAFIGNPMVLLLDEPTSGCDSYSRECVRKNILSHKNTDYCAILVSTHHVDDIEVLGERVWFLNDRYLEFEGPVSLLATNPKDRIDQTNQSHSNSYYQNNTKSDELEDYIYNNNNNNNNDNNNKINNNNNNLFGDTIINNNDDYDFDLEFSTWNLELKKEFISHFGKLLSDDWISEQSTIENDITTWTIPNQPNAYFIQLNYFISNIQSVKNYENNWNLNSTTLFKSLSHLYSSSNKQRKRSISDKVNTSGVLGIDQQINEQILNNNNNNNDNNKSLIFIALACRDLSYQKVELTSSRFNGVGEVCVSHGSNDYSFGVNNNYYVNNSSNNNSSSNQFKDTSLFDDLVDPPSHTINNDDDYNHLFTQKSNIMDSDRMLLDLYLDYYRHSSRRWGAYVINDNVKKWIASRVTITQLVYNNISMIEMFDELIKTRDFLCGNDNNISSFTSFVSICGENPSITFALHYNNTIINNYDVLKNNRNDNYNYYNNSDLSIVITSYEDMHSNLTMLTNVTNDHATPVFLKEVTPLLYDNINNKINDINNNINNNIDNKNNNNNNEYDNNVNNNNNNNIDNKNNNNRYDNNVNNNNNNNIDNKNNNNEYDNNVNNNNNNNIDNKNNNNNNNNNNVNNNNNNNIDNKNNNNGYDNNIDISNRILNSIPLVARYRLYSHPLPEINLSNIVYLERGYLGSTIIILYIIITTSITAKYVVKTRKIQIKKLFHLSGMHPISYWK